MTLNDWGVAKCDVHWKSRLHDHLNIDSSMKDLLIKMSSGLNFLALVSKDRTQLNCCTHNIDIIQFITHTYSGDISKLRKEPIKGLGLFAED